MISQYCLQLLELCGDLITISSFPDEIEQRRLESKLYLPPLIHLL
jgi:hypothetical protein